MNKKLKIYSTLFVVVLVYLVVTSVVHIDSYGWGQGGHDKLEFVDEAPGFMTRDTLEGGAVRTITKPTLSYEVYVKPKDLSKQRVLLSTAKSIHQSSAGETQTYKVEMQKVKLVTPTSETSFSFHIIFAIVSALVVTIVIVWILNLRNPAPVLLTGIVKWNNLFHFMICFKLNLCSNSACKGTAFF